MGSIWFTSTDEAAKSLEVAAIGGFEIMNGSLLTPEELRN